VEIRNVKYRDAVKRTFVRGKKYHDFLQLEPKGLDKNSVPEERPYEEKPKREALQAKFKS
jgi:hypothetical protein